MGLEINFSTIDPTRNLLFYNECLFSINLLRKTQNTLQMIPFLVQFSVSAILAKSEIFFKSPSSCQIYFVGHTSIIAFVNIKYILKNYALKYKKSSKQKIDFLYRNNRDHPDKMASAFISKYRVIFILHKKLC